MITKVQLAAMQRIDIPEKDRRDFYLYVDEFQNFATESFANILSEARKYRLNLIIAHQYIEQLDEKVAAAVFGNVGTIICFRVGGADAEALLNEFTPRFTEEDLVNLTKYNIYLKLMIDGVSSDPFSATTFPPLAEDEVEGNRENIINVSRERYAKSRGEVEDKIIRWTGISIGEEGTPLPKPVQRPARAGGPARDVRPSFQTGSPRPPLADQGNRPNIPQQQPKPVAQPPIQQQARLDSQEQARQVQPIQQKPAQTMQAKPVPKTEGLPAQAGEQVKYPAVCSRCGKKIMLSFKPDPTKPIYCRQCLKIVRREEKTTKDEPINLNQLQKAEPQKF
jgi:CxxC-x17-CxxC domain-containing protein